jgi:hypothetical protein
LPDSLFGVPQTIIVPKGRADVLTAVNSFIDDVRASGFLQNAITSSGIIGLQAAPARLLAAVSAGLIAFLSRTNSHAGPKLCGEMRVISADNRRTSMPEIRENNGVVTQITTVKVPADNQSEVLELMKGARPLHGEPARLRLGQPASQRRRQPRRELRSVEGTASSSTPRTTHPRFRKKWPGSAS